ncbi:MAG: ECF transporter S component [Ruminococcaceae bacterium]|nr:ECF transporter S component [Oscillospiraceae bacterium]
MSKTQNFTRLALILALLIILGFTPLGFISVPPLVSITIMHIPVIVGSIILGYTYGGVLGFAFGIISMIKAIMQPAGGDIFFSPVLSGNALASVVMCVAPRVVLGILPGLLLKLLKTTHLPENISIGIAAGISTVVHTFLVLFCLMVFFDGMILADIFTYIISINGVLELLAAVIVSVAVCRPLVKLFKRTANQ